MPEERGLYPKMQVREQLVFFGRLHGLDRGRRRRAGSTSCSNGSGWPTGLATFSRRCRSGNQQRVQIAAALVHEPIALVLDEPFSGLDPFAVDAMADLLRDEVGAEVPVLFSSHQLELVERLCDDLVVLSQGRLVAGGSVDELRGGRAPPCTEARSSAAGADAGWLRDVPGVQVRDVDGDSAQVDVGVAGREQDVLRAALERGPVLELTPIRAALSDVFREATNR